MLVNGILRQLERYLSLVFVVFYVSDMKVNETFHLSLRQFIFQEVLNYLLVSNEIKSYWGISNVI